MENQREKWDRVFRRIGDKQTSRDSWLERWLEVLEVGEAPILELGCGAGLDTRFLIERGFSVIATDFSEEALELTRRSTLTAEVMRLDMTLGLPFSNDEFQAVVASLCLHYFPWRETVEIVGEIHRCLEPGGFLLARVNSTNDEFYAKVKKQEIEPGFHLVDGMPKRLFESESIEALFAERWEIVSAEEWSTDRFGGSKTLWELVIKKKPDA